MAILSTCDRSLKNGLSEAKGTLMLMLQVTSLALSKKMTDIHQTATTHIVEQRRLIHAFLELSKRTEVKDNLDQITFEWIPCAVSPQSQPLKCQRLVESQHYQCLRCQITLLLR